MSLNRKEIIQKLGYLSKQDYEKWRKGQVPYLEKVIKINLKKISFIMKTVVKNSRNGKLKESWTSYKKWEKGPKYELIFTKSRNPHIEKTYSTHFIKTQVQTQKKL